MLFQNWLAARIPRPHADRRQRGRLRRMAADLVPAVECLEDRTLLTTLLIDYSLDSNNFFDTQAKKDLLQTVADSLTSRLTDDLEAITPGPSGFGFDNTWTVDFNHPGTGVSHDILDLAVPADTVIVYAGGRDLPGSTVGLGGPGGYISEGTPEFLNTVASRGEAGALDAPTTDFGPWGGSITFDTLTNWHFGETTAGLDNGEDDFFSIAQHELGHLMGIGTSGSWSDAIQAGNFTGAASVASFGGNVPLDGGLAHWNSGTMSNGESAGMNPSLTTGTRALFTELDFAALDDIGWDLLQVDYGDAPDTGAGTGSGNYETTSSDGGPSHTVITELFLGNSIDGEDGSLQNSAANADDSDGAPPNDEDGVLNPLDLQAAEGAAPTITVLATNTSGSAATLSGWIDFNSNGVFDNSTERAQISVPDSTTDGRFTLTFPTISTGSAGNTYARLRLSTDAAAANPTGSASDGEVEDYAFRITTPGQSIAESFVSINSETSGGPTIDNADRFGSAVASIGDIDGDGVNDLAVGAYQDDTGGTNRGAVHILRLNSDASIKNSQTIGHGSGGLSLANSDNFGSSIAAVGDLDGDGISEIAVGSERNDSGGANRGAVYIVFLNSDGTAKSSLQIASATNGGPTLADGDQFGSALAALGDLDGDGVPDLAVGANFDGTGGSQRGAVYVLLLNANGSAKQATKIANGTNGGPTLSNGDRFGTSVTAVGDLDSDGVVDVAVGASLDDTGGSQAGAVYVLTLNANGTVKGSTEIASATNGGPTLAAGDQFGKSVTGLGDFDGDGVGDLLVGAERANSAQGAVYLVLLNSNGTVKSSRTVTDGPVLAANDWAGTSLAVIGDLNSDGVTDFATGAKRDDTGGTDRGAVYIVTLWSTGLHIKSPRNAITITDNLPRIEWTAVEGATSYAYWLSDKTRLISGVYRNFGYWPVTEFVTKDVLLPGNYELEVRAQRPTVGAWTTINFTIDETASPVITDPDETTAFPTVAWTAVTGAVTYDLTVTDTLGNPVRSKTGLTTTRDTESFDPGTYRATVQAKDGGGSNVGAASPEFEFTVAGNVAVTNDVEGEISDATPFFEWTEVPGAVRYELWADNRTTTTVKAVHDAELFDALLQSRPVLDDHEFQWQIKATGWNGTRGGWTPIKRFNVVLPSPAAPVVTVPAANSTTTDTTPTIDWNDVEYASIYDLWVNNRTTGQSQVIRQTALTVSTFTPSTPLTLGEYSIEVRAANEQRTTYGSNISSWSTLVIFTIAGGAQASSAHASSRVAPQMASQMTPHISPQVSASGNIT